MSYCTRRLQPELASAEFTTAKQLWQFCIALRTFFLFRAEMLADMYVCGICVHVSLRESVFESQGCLCCLHLTISCMCHSPCSELLDGRICSVLILFICRQNF